MAKFKEKIEAKSLRGQGKSIKEIAKLLHVSPASVSDWCKDVVLSAGQIKLLEQHARDPFYGKRLTNSLRQKQTAIDKTNNLFREGQLEVGDLTKRDLFIAGISLYWAEGFKKDSQAGLASMDPGMINFFIRWLKGCFSYKLEDLSVRVTVNASHEYRVREIEKHWSKETGIPLESFQKPFYQRFKWKKVYENQNEYYGVLRVKVRKSTDFLRKVNGYIQGLRNQAQIG
jgi:transcriptional regulator with XRE-family HTH domain